jgi:hypothetical protein
LRVFSDEEELALREFILANFINPGLFLLIRTSDYLLCSFIPKHTLIMVQDDLAVRMATSAISSVSVDWPVVRTITRGV